METIEIELSRIFVKVVQQGSFSKAAELLKIPKSSVSKGLARLENLTGTKLLLRTTRSQTLTAAGRAFYETCLEPIQILEDAQKSLLGQDTIVSGTIKLTAAEDIGTYVIAPVIGELCRTHPKISFELHYTNEVVDLVKDGFDLAVRFGKLAESQLKVRPVGHIDMIAVAAPSYLAAHKKIQEPRDLSEHDCLCLRNHSMSRTWVLQNDKKKLSVSVKPRVESHQMTSLLKIATAGAGVLFAPRFLCRGDIENGNLARVLPGWTGVGIPVSIVSPVSIAATARLKLVSDYIAAAIQKELD